MWKRFLVATAGLVFVTTNSYSVLAQSVMASAGQKKDPGILVIRLKNASLEDLKKLSFLELNALKNAVYASKGYKFADDRPWLQELFCPEITAARIEAYQNEGSDEDSPAPRVPDANELAWYASMRGQTRWNLDEYAFPGCRDGGQLDDDQKKALANIRVATFKKIAGLNDINKVDHVFLDREMTGKVYQKVTILIMGRPVELSLYQGIARESILRDVHGYAQLLKMIANVEKDFDAMELLGLYAGDIIFLRNIIETKYGKSTSGVLEWEISQLIGVTEKKQNYDPKDLPVKIQVKLQVLDDIVRKIMQSDLNDVPKELKNQPIDLNFDPYGSAAC
jgi:hypothetical protein